MEDCQLNEGLIRQSSHTTVDSVYLEGATVSSASMISIHLTLQVAPLACMQACLQSLSYLHSQYLCFHYPLLQFSRSPVLRLGLAMGSLRQSLLPRSGALVEVGMKQTPCRQEVALSRTESLHPEMSLQATQNLQLQSTKQKLEQRRKGKKEKKTTTAAMTTTGSRTTIVTMSVKSCAQLLAITALMRRGPRVSRQRRQEPAPHRQPPLCRPLLAL